MTSAEEVARQYSEFVQWKELLVAAMFRQITEKRDGILEPLAAALQERIPEKLRRKVTDEVVRELARRMLDNDLRHGAWIAFDGPLHTEDPSELVNALQGAWSVFGLTAKATSSFTSYTGGQAIYRLIKVGPTGR